MTIADIELEARLDVQVEIRTSIDLSRYFRDEVRTTTKELSTA